MQCFRSQVYILGIFIGSVKRVTAYFVWMILYRIPRSAFFETLNNRKEKPSGIFEIDIPIRT